jgi:enoyl-CoA hydratase
MNYSTLQISREQGTLTVTIDRPEVRNALSPQVFDELYQLMAEIAYDEEIRVVIITGAGGKAFASGADIRSLNERATLDVLKSKAQDVLAAIESLDKPVIAAIDGYALGGGCELALACDIRIATQKSKLGQPEVNLGIIPGMGGTQRLQRVVGIGKAKELIFTGDILSAEQALAIGLLNAVVEDADDLQRKAMDMADKIANKGPRAVSLAKMAINTGANTDIHSGLLFEKMAQTVAFSTQDRTEGTSAFLEKRTPKFTGN